MRWTEEWNRLRPPWSGKENATVRRLLFEGGQQQDWKTVQVRALARATTAIEREFAHESHSQSSRAPPDKSSRRYEETSRRFRFNNATDWLLLVCAPSARVWTLSLQSVLSFVFLLSIIISQSRSRSPYQLLKLSSDPLYPIYSFWSNTL